LWDSGLRGWLDVLVGRKIQDPGLRRAAASCLLGIDQRTANRLFSLAAWPEKFCEPFDAAKTPAKRARIAAERIEHFIATDGAE